MNDLLSAGVLMKHIRALATDIGPRPAGQPAENQARAYVRQVLTRHGIDTIEEQQFQTRPTVGIGIIIPLALTLAANLLSFAGRFGRILGTALTATSTASIWRLFSGQRSLLERVEPKVTSANLIARIPPTHDKRRTLVFIGHIDSQKKQTLTEQQNKHMMIKASTIWLGLLVINSLAQGAQSVKVHWLTSIMQWISALMLGFILQQALNEERQGYVAGANDNATAVACLLGLGAQFRATPLRNTEIWLAFTGSEEVLCTGLHHLLDIHDSELRDAWFIDFEMVGTDDIAYVTRHSGLSMINAYTPDTASLRLAEQTSHDHPELRVHGQEMTIVEEVGTLRGRNFRGICLVGVGRDGWLANWHQYSDITENIVPEGVERAARFAYRMAQKLDNVQ
jgi:hypothetical protein